MSLAITMQMLEEELYGLSETQRAFIKIGGENFKYYIIDKATGIARYGRIGYKPQEHQYRPIDVPSKASEKLAKGYTEITGDERLIAKYITIKKV